VKPLVVSTTRLAEALAKSRREMDTRRQAAAGDGETS